MKLLPWILSLLIMAFLLPVHPAELSDADLDKLTSEDIAKTLRHLQAIAQEAERRADEAERHEAATLGAWQKMTRENTSLQTALLTVEKTAREVEADRDAHAMRANAEHERAGKAEVAKVKAEKRAIVAIGIAATATLAAVVMGYLLLKP